MYLSFKAKYIVLILKIVKIVYFRKYIGKK